MLNVLLAGGLNLGLRKMAEATSSHVSDQFGPFATQNILATVNEAPYILDGMLMNEVGQKIRDQYTDTDGFTGHGSPSPRCCRIGSFLASGICH